MLRTVLIVAWVLIAASATSAGGEYYLTSVQERPFLDDHALFSSSGFLGHGYGVVGSGFMFLGVLLYSVRKRLPSLARTGKLKHWLQVHIFLCTLGPFLILLHSTFRVGGLVAIAFWSMVLVVVSGVFGRYVYVRIPKNLHGSFLTADAIEMKRAKAYSALQNRGSMDGMILSDPTYRRVPPPPRSLLHALAVGFRWETRRRKMEQEIRQLLDRVGGPPRFREEIIALALEESRLAWQIGLLGPLQRLFRYWHVFHLPLAIVMFLILAVHVTVAVLFGYGWVL